MKKYKKVIAKISILSIALLIMCAAIAIPKYINKLDKISEMKATAEDTTERQIYGIYTSDNQKITEIGVDGTFVLGEYIDVYCLWTPYQGDTLEYITDSPDIISVTNDGVNGCNRITAKKVGTVLLRYRCVQDPSVYYDIYIKVSNPSEGTSIRKIYGIYNSNDQQITEVGTDGTFKVGNYIDIYCRWDYKQEGDTLNIDTDSHDIIDISDDGVNGCNRITAKSVGTALLRYSCVQDPSVYCDIYIKVSDESERQIYGIYNSNGQQIENIGLVEKFYVGDTIDTHCSWNKISGETLTITTDNYDVIDISLGVGEVGSAKITAKSEGTATLQYYYANNPSVRYEIPVTVSAPKREIHGIYNVNNNQNITNIGADGKFVVGDYIDIICDWTRNTGDTLQLTTDNWNVIDINVGGGNDNSSRITAKNPGTATLRYTCVQDTSVYYEIPVTVTEVSETNIGVEKITLNKNKASIKVGDTLQLSATILPTNATNKNVTWSVSNSSIASIDSNGLLTAISTGTVKAYATSQSDTSVKAECEVTIIAKDTDTDSSTGDKEDTDSSTGDKEDTDSSTGDKEDTDSSTGDKEDTDSSTGDKEDTDSSTGDKEDADSSTGDKEDADSSTGDKEDTDSRIEDKKDTGSNVEDKETKTSSSSSDKTKTSLSSLPYTGIQEKILIFLVICGVISIFAWFKSRDIKY